MINRIFDDEPRLPFPTRNVNIWKDTIEEYIIPDEHKASVLQKLYPFVPVPSLDKEMYDIHAGKKFFVKDYFVTREGGMNMLVSPYYYESGGSVIDWIPAEEVTD
jgi:hypothetical protein